MSASPSWGDNPGSVGPLMMKLAAWMATIRVNRTTVSGITASTRTRVNSGPRYGSALRRTTSHASPSAVRMAATPFPQPEPSDDLVRQRIPGGVDEEGVHREPEDDGCRREHEEDKKPRHDPWRPQESELSFGNPVNRPPHPGGGNAIANGGGDQGQEKEVPPG